MALTFAALAAWGFSRHGQAGLWAAVVAALICWLSATAALILTALFVGTTQAFQSQLGGIMLRTMVPFALGLFIQQQSSYLAGAGFFGLLVLAYLVALATETLLCVWLIGPARSVAKAS